jgi:hypothetical protein
MDRYLGGRILPQVLDMKLYYNQGAYILDLYSRWYLWTGYEEHLPRRWVPLGIKEYSTIIGKPFVTDWAPLLSVFDSPEPLYTPVPMLHFLLLTGLDFYRTIEDID